MRTALIPLAFLAVAAVITISAAQAQTFYTPVSVTTNTDTVENPDLYPVINLIQGPGVGFDSSAPNDALGGGDQFLWVTDAPLGFPSNYIDFLIPVLEFDLGADTAINSLSVWGYSDGNANGARDISLRFATEADGAGNYGTSITSNPAYVVDYLPTPRQAFALGETLTTRYVELTINSLYFGVDPPNLPGGDRAGLGEVSFTIPEPTSITLCGLGLILLSLTRRRK